MSYVETVLMPGEKVVYDTKPHWIIFAPSVFWLVAAFLVLIFGHYIPDLRINIGMPLYLIIVIICVLLSFYYVIGSYIRYIASEFAITNQRVIMKVGLIRRFICEILLQKVESVKIDQTVTARLIGYGDITVNGVGGTKDKFKTIPEPLKFHETVQRETERLLEKMNAPK